MGVRKIFIVLITIVVCVVLGAFILNVIMPNTVNGLVNAVESTLYNATGMQIDFNGDGTAQTRGTTGLMNDAVTDETFATDGVGVEGYE